SLTQQRAPASIAFGGKSANLGEVLNARLPGIIVPNGFTIPFYYYDEFIKRNNLDDAIFGLLNDQKFVHDPAYRRKQLVQLRQKIETAEFSPELRKSVLEKVAREYAGKGLFVRSSSNSEDLPNFSGAGLYTTVPNVRGDEQLIDAIRKVWASLWNFEAYEARERASVDHSKIFMAVVLEGGEKSERCGVRSRTDRVATMKKSAMLIIAQR